MRFQTRSFALILFGLGVIGLFDTLEAHRSFGQKLEGEFLRPSGLIPPRPLPVDDSEREKKLRAQPSEYTQNDIPLAQMFRNAGRRLQKRKVTELRFHGFDMGYDTGYEPDSLIVRDPRMIEIFLDALRRAETAPNIHGLPCPNTVAFCYLRAGKTADRTCEEFRFSPLFPDGRDSYGPVFYKALKSLESFEGQRLARTAKSLQG